jgi:hypothetical protein
MDEALTRFHAAAALESRGRGRMGRRYSVALRAQAVRYWAEREPKGDGLSEVAAAPGVLRTREHSMPMVFGTRVPTIVLPAVADTWSQDRRRAVILA